MQRSSTPPRLGQVVNVFSSLWPGARPAEIVVAEKAGGVFLVEARLSADPKLEPELHAVLSLGQIRFTTPRTALYGPVDANATVSTELYGAAFEIGRPDGSHRTVRFAVFEVPTAPEAASEP